MNLTLIALLNAEAHPCIRSFNHMLNDNVFTKCCRHGSSVCLQPNTLIVYRQCVCVCHRCSIDCPTESLNEGSKG